MKQSKLFLLALLALITFSCRAIKQTSTAKDEVKTSANLDVKQTVDNQLKVDSSQSVIDKSVTNSLINEDVIITDFSKPDSTGKQWPTQTTVIHRTTDNKKSADVKTDVKVNTSKQNKTTLRDNSKYKSDDKSQLVMTKETKCPAWVYVVGFFSLLVAIIGVYTLLKRFGVIK